MSQNHGCFTTMRIDPLPDAPGRIGARGWALHAARLQRDSRTLFGVAVGEADMVASVHEALRDAGGADRVERVELPLLVRLAVHRPHIGGVTRRDERADPACNPAHVGAEPADAAQAEIETATRKVTPSAVPLRVRAVRHDRQRPEMKHTLTTPELDERDAAIRAGFDDAVFVTADGELSEGTTWSLVLGRPDGSWVTPSAPSLPSITVALLRGRGPITAEPVRAEALGGFDRAAAVGSGRGVHRITSIDSVPFTEDVNRLQAAYDAVPLTPIG